MRRKVTLFFVFLLSINLFSQENNKSIFLNSQAQVKDYFIAAGEMIMVDLLVYDFNNLFLSSKPIQTSFSVFKQNLSSPWIFDNSSFKRNQLFHPYFGALYFLSGRSNNLNFTESFLLSTMGSFLWEAYLEGPVSSLNDFITTPTAGAITGEILHRLSFSVYDYSPFLSWVLSPVDGINQLLRNSRAITPRGKIYSFSTSILSGFSIYDATYDSLLTPGLGAALNVIYNNPYGHASKELYDQFTLDLFYSFWPENQLFKMNMDGLLYSIPIYPTEKALSNIAVSFDYDVLYGSNITLSNSSLGLCLMQSFGDKEKNQVNYCVQTDFVYLSTSDIFYLLKNNNTNYEKPFKQAPYTYKYGPEIKFSFEFFNSLFGNLSFKCASEYLFTYKNSTNDEELKTDLLIFTADASYEHKIFNNYYGGIRNLFILKNEYRNSIQINRNIINNTDLYIKILY